MATSLGGKVALITGGNSGIGKATALLFATEGATVVITARRKEEGEQVAREIVDAGGTATFIATDVSCSGAVADLVRQVVNQYGTIDCLFNNAGISGTPGVPLADLAEDEWDSVIDINLKGVWLMMKYVIPVMQKSGGGSIVNMSSVYGLVSSHLQMSAYTASKHGVIGLTRSPARDYAGDNIRVNAICPAYIHTPMVDEPIENDPALGARILGLHPIGRLGSVGEIAEAVLWLACDKSSFVTGHALAADGGLTLG